MRCKAISGNEPCLKERCGLMGEHWKTCGYLEKEKK